jgi:predicted dehydrogenase
MASIGVHLIDLMIWMLGRVARVHCVAEQRCAPHGLDTTSAILSFASGATGLLFGSVAAARNHRVAVYGSRGCAEVTTPTMDVFRFVPAVQGRASHLAHIPDPETIEARGFNSVAAELNAFARCAREGRAYPIAPADILHGVEVTEACVRSQQSGSPVSVTRDSSEPIAEKLRVPD